MGIHQMFLKYWLILFSVWFNGNLLGLNISDSFKSTVTIYIIIPFLIIPQIILSGVLVPFDKLNPTAENLAAYFYQQLSNELNDARVAVKNVTIWETDRACVSYTEED